MVTILAVIGIASLLATALLVIGGLLALRQEKRRVRGRP